MIQSQSQNTRKAFATEINEKGLDNQFQKAVDFSLHPFWAKIFGSLPVCDLVMTME